MTPDGFVLWTRNGGQRDRDSSMTSAMPRPITAYVGHLQFSSHACLQSLPVPRLR